MDYEIRRITAGADDVVYSHLSQIDKECVGAEGWSEGSFRSECEKDCGIVLAAYSGGDIVGLLSGYFASGEGDITSVAVSRDHRRKGIADRLLEEFETLLPADTESIFLEVRQSNQPAVSLYEKHGYKRLSVRKRFYSDPTEDAIVMQKRLTDNNTI